MICPCSLEKCPFKCNEDTRCECDVTGPCATGCKASPKESAAPVADFTGTIDGAGVKSVMKEMKTPLELIPPQFTEGIAEVLKFGAKKYAPNNWMRGMSWETVAGGIMRHVTAFRRGEEIDPESDQPHLYHAACGLMFLSWYAHGPNVEHLQFDDRKFRDEVEEGK